MVLLVNSLIQVKYKYLSFMPLGLAVEAINNGHLTAENVHTENVHPMFLPWKPNHQFFSYFIICFIISFGSTTQYSQRRDITLDLNLSETICDVG